MRALNRAVGDRIALGDDQLTTLLNPTDDTAGAAVYYQARKETGRFPCVVFYPETDDPDGRFIDTEIAVIIYSVEVWTQSRSSTANAEIEDYLDALLHHQALSLPCTGTGIAARANVCYWIERFNARHPAVWSETIHAGVSYARYACHVRSQTIAPD